jgi:hypothetical protein
MTDTLSYHKVRPFLRKLDLSGVPVSVVASQWDAVQKMLKAEDGKLQVAPEEDALWFYMSLHAMREISLQFEDFEPLMQYQKFVEKYHKVMQVKALRMFYYLLMITTRESRHAHGTGSLSKLYNEYPDVKPFHMNIRGGGTMSAVNRLVSSPPKMTLGPYVEFIRRQFTCGGYGGGYGGKPWADVAQCLEDFVKGKITAEMMMDTAFTLCHNNGPIFNKGMVYKTYMSSEIRKILDVQRSGQIPQLVAEGGAKHITAKMRTYQKELMALIPSFGGYVDWFQVEKLGALSSYPSQKQAQEALHGKSKQSAQEDKLKALKLKAAAVKQEKEQVEFLAKHLEIMPDVFVEKITRKEIAA